ncbi:MAG: RHS repeat-associated core domain-containing protein, partial [Candidatus Symbiothrix sp.]|nr:RHS repeat-associated core domain-containing protein [Candidatus Symbiothrix sp.]
NGNQATLITDNATADGFPLGSTSYTYDANGNTIAEGSTSILYNLLNLPVQVQLTAGRSIENTYAYDGRKLATVAMENGELKEGTKTYNGNLVFDKNGDLEYVLFSEGRILHDNGSFTFEYHLKDHLGSTRVAFEPTTSGTSVTQENAYYPFGGTINNLSWSVSDNRYLREGKEYISDFGWNKHDYIGRHFDLQRGGGLQIDPMCEKYYSISPYMLFANNPVRFVDPTGMWIEIYYDNINY